MRNRREGERRSNQTEYIGACRESPTPRIPCKQSEALSARPVVCARCVEAQGIADYLLIIPPFNHPARRGARLHVHTCIHIDQYCRIHTLHMPLPMHMKGEEITQTKFISIRSGSIVVIPDLQYHAVRTAVGPVAYCHSFHLKRARFSVTHRKAARLISFEYYAWRRQAHCDQR